MIIRTHLKFFFFLSATLLLTFSSCEEENPSVIYNNTLVYSKESIDLSFSTFNTRLSKTLKNKDFSNLGVLINPMLDSVAQQIKIVNLLKAPENGMQFKLNTIIYLESVAKAVDSYRSYGILSDENITIEQIDSINKDISKSESSLYLTSKKLLSAQNEFAKAAKIKLDKNNY